MRGFMSMALGCALLGLVGCGQPARTADVNVQQSIETAKRKVYPSLVFVKPIREVFESGERERAEVFGSGVIVSPDGYVVTNNHVAEKAIQVNCVLGDKEQVTAKVVGLDPETDLALLKLQVKPEQLPLPCCNFGDSDTLEEGQFVMALGSPFGFSRSISLGIVSNTRRYIGFNSQYQYNLWIQTDAAINPGNSGGPLVNTDGQIVGINTLGIGGGGIGFAIPANVAMDVVARLKDAASKTEEKDWPVKVQRAYTGLQLQALKDFNTNTFTEGVTVEASQQVPHTGKYAPSMSVTTEYGVLVKNVDAGSPAEEAGFQAGDILLAIQGENVDGQYVEELPAIRRQLADLPLDKPTDLKIVRRGEQTQLAVTPVLKGKFEGEDFELARWNLTVKEITKFSNPQLHFQHGDGVFVQGVRYPGNAMDAGLENNDVILKIGQREVKTIADVRAAFEGCCNDTSLTEKKVLITIKRGGFQMWKTLDWTKDYQEED